MSVIVFGEYYVTPALIVKYDCTEGTVFELIEGMVVNDSIDLDFKALICD
jgi:hypothetical protein